MSCQVYEWLRVHEKGGNDADRLSILSQNNAPYYFQVCNVKCK